MGIKNAMVRMADKAGNAVAKVSALSSAQLDEIERKREAYLSEKPDPSDPQAIELTNRLLATAGLHDPRVAYWEPAKYVARLRSLSGQEDDGQNAGRVLLKTIMSAGHGGPSGRYEYLRETAFEYAFFLDAVG